MLTTSFKRERTRATYATVPAGPYLDDFRHWLEKRGVTTRTIRPWLFGATQYAAWAEAAGVPVQSLDATILDAFRDALAKHGRRRYVSGNPTARCIGAHHFLTFLSAHGIVSASAVAAPSPAPPPCCPSFSTGWAYIGGSLSQHSATTALFSSICSRHEAIDRHNLRPRAYALFSWIVPIVMAKAQPRMW